MNKIILPSCDKPGIEYICVNSSDGIRIMGRRVGDTEVVECGTFYLRGKDVILASHNVVVTERSIEEAFRDARQCFLSTVDTIEGKSLDIEQTLKHVDFIFQCYGLPSKVTFTYNKNGIQTVMEVSTK